MFNKILASHWVKLAAILLASLLISTVAMAQEARPRLGLSLSSVELPSLLLQHLKLAPGEGLMIDNIAVGGEIEALGLSKGDILLSIDAQPITTVAELNAYIAKLAPKTRVSLEVIQKGEHRQVFVTLDSLPDNIVWKHVDDLQLRPQRALRSLQHQALPSPRGAQTPNAQAIQNSQRMVFRSQIASPNGIKQSNVTIEGDPQNADSRIEIVIDNRSYQSTVGDIESLPDEPRIAAQNALHQAGQFSFSFGGGSDPFEEMMQQHRREMENFQEIFQRLMFQAPIGPRPGASPIRFEPQTGPAPIQS